MMDRLELFAERAEGDGVGRMRMHDRADVGPGGVDRRMRLVILHLLAGLAHLQVLGGDEGRAGDRMHHHAAARQPAAHVEGGFGAAFIGKDAASGHEIFAQSLFVLASDIGNLRACHSCSPGVKWAYRRQL
jgi:hypothetical protein